MCFLCLCMCVKRLTILSGACLIGETRAAAIMLDLSKRACGVMF